MDSLAFAKIDNFHGVIAEGAKEEPLTSSVEREMINPTLDPG